MKKAYSKKFASIYDSVNSAEFYSKYVDLIKNAIRDYGNFEAVKILDIACGTGILIKLLRKDYPNIEGVDSSLDMLQEAKKRNEDVIFYNQDFLNLNTSKKYNVVISTFDSINYILNLEDLQSSFKLISQHLGKGGLFIFDFNTNNKKVNKIITKGNVVYRSNIEEGYWNAVVEMKDGEEVVKESHKERMYSMDEIGAI